VILNEAISVLSVTARVTVDTKENQNEGKTLCNTAYSARIQGFRAVLSLKETTVSHSRTWTGPTPNAKAWP
jgi:hypothetical protein